MAVLSVIKDLRARTVKKRFSPPKAGALGQFLGLWPRKRALRAGQAWFSYAIFKQRFPSIRPDRFDVQKMLAEKREMTDIILWDQSVG